MKICDVDQFLQDDGVEIKLKGKSFVIKDIPLELQEAIDADNVDIKDTVKKILQCTDEDLEGYGLKALNYILKEIYENLSLDSSQQNQ